MADSPVKVEDGGAERKAGYKSWKKKYRKMRIVFEQKMHDGEDLHKQEAKAMATVKRLAVENEYPAIGSSPRDQQFSPDPPEKQIDLSLPSSDVGRLGGPDEHLARRKELAMRKLEQLLSDVPHSSYTAARESQPSIVTDLAAADGDAHPVSFLSADDIDNYIHTVDTAIDPDKHIPTLAPSAHPEAHPPPNPHLKNPTSVTNWLRKYKPNIFLQDGEVHADDDADGTHNNQGSGAASSRKPRGGRAERGGKASARGKRASTSARLAAGDRGDWDASMDDDPDFGATPVVKGKRKRDDDSGYKPRGSSSRPSKKKRKSEGDSTPTARKSKKELVSATSKEE
ncbi:IEC3 subunit of the Ino80 complex, chromatin re-modelling-domain-containing protein [Stachybotrys elegans]|uniref:IEC3 subunit of the Ino80 complex, chromatin re-modelling-domain-containing protein n=1 Tax=Stachybotrys elegans TaxID=80388 RepID=A0A8K0WUM0_9HYPO|nr:IEC3 subunit of the Ino80 complex, chromatin re-modelling-domain-containing protein [Stachybotrys elegans]